MSGMILLSGVRLESRVGVPEEERRSPQEVVVDVELQADTRRAAASDDPSDAVDYARVREVLAAVASERPRRLIETLAEDMARAVLREFAVARVRLLLRKPAALRRENVDYAGVEIVRERDG